MLELARRETSGMLGASSAWRRDLGMVDPYRDAQTTVAESLAERRAELDRIDEALIPLCERREEVIADIDSLHARLNVLKAGQERKPARRGHPAMVGFGLFVMSAFSAAYLMKPTCRGAKWPQAQEAHNETRALRLLAETVLADKQSAGCPTLAEIAGVNAGRDPWQNPYRIQCSDGTVHVYSSGPDGILNTRDDIRDDASLAALHARMR